jgi:mono/diheme cytochrome c family protein
MFNWTAVNDEMHDFEANTRGVSGGLGAITTATVQTDCNQLDKETAVSVVVAGAINGALLASNKELADDPVAALCGHKDWDDINAFVKTIAPVHASKVANASAISNGRQVFLEGGCAKCHGGSGWTVSTRPYNPAGGGAVTFGALAFTRPAFLANVMYNVPRTSISNQPVITADATGPGVVEVPVLQLACALRNVGTFGVPNDTVATEALEKRANGALLAEGRAGYNVPSLYGLALGAPYLHHGQATTLDDLFSDPQWGFHTNAANANFSLSLGSSTTKLPDLITFLLSIDATTAEIELPTDPASGASFDACVQ